MDINAPTLKLTRLDFNTILVFCFRFRCAGLYRARQQKLCHCTKY
uniref:Uncharacterized protein n=1 Tax=Anguilla anguilla TaxID=7936 RepID=A0A0E9SI29_ANGAN